MDEQKTVNVEVVDDGKQHEQRTAFKQKLDAAWDTTKRAAKNGLQFVSENKEAIFTAGTIIAGCVAFFKGNKTQSDRERDRIDTTYYDPTTGAHWRLKRPLSNRERMELMRRRREGEFTEDILDDMNVLRWR